MDRESIPAESPTEHQGSRIVCVVGFLENRNRNCLKVIFGTRVSINSSLSKSP
jgi:hypothetical protein